MLLLDVLNWQHMATILGWSDAAMFNLNKVLELTLNHGKCLLTKQQIGLDLGSLETYKTYQDLENAFKNKLIIYW